MLYSFVTHTTFLSLFLSSIFSFFLITFFSGCCNTRRPWSPPLRPLTGKCLNCFYCKICPGCRSHVFSYIFFVHSITAEAIVEKLSQQTSLRFFTVLPSFRSRLGLGELVPSFSHCSVLDPSSSHIYYGQGHAASLIWTCRWYEVTIVTSYFIICTVTRQVTCIEFFSYFSLS